MAHKTKEEVWLLFAAALASAISARVGENLCNQIGKEADMMVKEWETRFGQSWGPHGA